MNNFSFSQKTSIYFGSGEEKLAGQKIKEYSDSCLIVHDGGDYLKNLLAVVKESLNNAGIRFCELDEVQPNPLVSKANEGIELCNSKNLGFVLGIGGGSVMDTAKYIALAANAGEHQLNVTPESVFTHKVLPHGAVVTLAGTGSECSKTTMIVNDLEKPVAKKYSIKHPEISFDFAIINPELTYSLPPKQVAAGAMDAISHALEGYFGLKEEEPLMESYIEGIVRTILRYGPMALKEPNNYKIRSVLSMAAMLAINESLSNAGVIQDWGCHRIERQITTRFHGTHGITLGIVTPSFIRFMYKKNPRSFINFAVRCFDVNPSGKNDKEIVFEGAERLERWLVSMGLPVRFSEIGLKADMMIDCAKASAPAGAVYKISEDEILAICKMAE